MSEIFDTFPDLKSEMLIIRKMSEDDVDALCKITSNDNVYKYIPPFLYRKSRNTLITAIRNLGGRDFEKKKLIICGIYMREEPDKLIGLAEMFDYKKKADMITIGYRLDEEYWHRGIATDTVKILIDYLCNDVGIRTLKAFVMPENIFSEKALIKNGFIKETEMVQEKNWGGKETADLNVFNYISV